MSVVFVSKKDAMGESVLFSVTARYEITHALVKDYPRRIFKTLIIDGL
jgi:hypothetical protein